MKLRVEHLHTSRRGDVGGSDRTRALLAQIHDHRLVVLTGDDQALDVEDDLGDVFLHTGDRGELVEHAVHAQARHGRTRDAREQGAAQGIAQRVAEARFERLNDEP